MYKITHSVFIFVLGGVFMNVDKIKNDESVLNKVKIGSCLELNFKVRHIEDEIISLEQYLDDNQFLLNNQLCSTITIVLASCRDIISNLAEVYLSDVDKEEEFCDYIANNY